MRAFTVHDVEQRSDAWFALRAGRLTGSLADALLAERKRGTGELAVRRDARRKLVVERLTGIPAADSAKSAAMQHGIDTEAAAFRAYEARTGQMVRRAGFLAHTDLMVGASPDGYVGDFTGVLELKCPDSATHLDYLQANELPAEYRGQVIHTLWLSGAQWVDFMSYDDRFIAPELRTFLIRVKREDVDLAAYELLVRMFLREVDDDVAALLALMQAA